VNLGATLQSLLERKAGALVRRAAAKATRIYSRRVIMEAVKSYRQWEAQAARLDEPSMIAKESAAIWFYLGQHQRSMGVEGGFLELGTFRGHAASVMAAMSRPGEGLVLVDIAVQEEATRRNVGRAGDAAQPRLRFVEGDTRQILAKDSLRDCYGECRWVHVDGEHSADGATNDLWLALRALHPDGLIVVDDFFNIASACITHAVFSFLDQHPHELRMFLCGFNKAYLARPKYVGQYRELCAGSLVEYLEKCGIEATLSENAHSTELDYRSVLPRRGGIRYRGVGFMRSEID
jgi:predicted O-methyltransferase YrrM